MNKTIQDSSAWVLRIGVVTSALVMLTGVGFSFAHGTASLDRIKSASFDPNWQHLFQGISAGSGKSIVELGVLLLALTPVMRVAVSAIIFTFIEHDWLYALITALVLIMTITGLFLA